MLAIKDWKRRMWVCKAFIEVNGINLMFFVIYYYLGYKALHDRGMVHAYITVSFHVICCYSSMQNEDFVTMLLNR